MRYLGDINPPLAASLENLRDKSLTSQASPRVWQIIINEARSSGRGLMTRGDNRIVIIAWAACNRANVTHSKPICDFFVEDN